MSADQIAVVWMLGFASACAVFHCLGLTMRVPVVQERPSSLPKVRTWD